MAGSDEGVPSTRSVTTCLRQEKTNLEEEKEKKQEKQEESEESEEEGEHALSDNLPQAGEDQPGHHHPQLPPLHPAPTRHPLLPPSLDRTSLSPGIFWLI